MSSAHFLRHIRDWFGPKTLKFILNIWPPLAGSGIRVTHISPDFKSVDVTLKLHWYNKNYVGVQYGGSLYSMTDPFYMLILLKNLGEDYIIWDKAAKIDFKKPGTGTVRAHFEMSDDELRDIAAKANESEKYIFDKSIDILNDENIVVANVVRTLYVKRKNKVTID